MSIVVDPHAWAELYERIGGPAYWKPASEYPPGVGVQYMVIDGCTVYWRLNGCAQTS